MIAAHPPETPLSLQERQADSPPSDQRYIKYIREKTDHLLRVMGTAPLRNHELDDQTLLELDPIGIIADSFQQILIHLNENNKELQHTQDELQAIFDATGVGISIIDIDFKIQRCNEKQRQLLVDHDQKEVVGRNCYEIYCALESPNLGCPAMETFATGRPAMVRGVRKKNKFFNVVTTPFARNSDGTVSKVIEVVLDITEKKQAQESEQQQRQLYLQEKNRLATVIESLSESLLVIDPTGSITTCNQAAITTLGRSEAEIVKQPLDLFFPKLWEILATGDELHTFEFSYHNQQGEELVLSADSNQMLHPHEGFGDRVITIKDITEKKRKLQISQRTEKLAAIGQLSAGVAHELNTPLTSILGYARLLLKDDNLSPEQRQRLEVITEQTQRSSSIIKNLLSFARNVQHDESYSCECDLNKVVDKVFPLLSPDLVKRKIALHFQRGSLPPVVADSGKLEQVIINLLLNSIQAIGQEGWIRVTTEARDGRTVLVVADNGPGVPEKIRSRIFDPFYSTKPVGEGTGLGLSICNRIVDDLGGEIAVQPTKGGGATLIVTLPGKRG